MYSVTVCIWHFYGTVSSSMTLAETLLWIASLSGATSVISASISMENLVVVRSSILCMVGFETNQSPSDLQCYHSVFIIHHNIFVCNIIFVIMMIRQIVCLSTHCQQFTKGCAAVQ